MLDFVPFTGPRREVTHRNLHPELIRQFLELNLPKTEPGAVAAAAIPYHQHLAKVAVALARKGGCRLTAADSLHCKAGGVVVDAHTDPPAIARKIIDAVGDRPTQFRIDKIVDQDFLGISLWPLFPPTILEDPHQLLFLRVDGDDRIALPQEETDSTVDMLELAISIRVLRPLKSLAVCLETVAQLVEQFTDQLMRDLMSTLLKFLRQMTHALGGPPQRRLRIAPCWWFQQSLQVGAQRMILLNRLLPAPSCSPD